MSARHHCAICPPVDSLVGIVVSRRQLHLCEQHHDLLDGRQPQSFDELAAIFAVPGLDRRAEPDRRVDERRHFPPRPEGRRMGSGRRRDDD